MSASGGKPLAHPGSSGEARQRWFAWASLIAVLAVAVVIVDPQRNLMTQDDGWAYARSVETLLGTGRYRLDQWSAANMPVQIGYAALLAKVFGFSFALLRWSTLALTAVLLLSFYELLRLLGVRPAASVVLSLGLLASPVLLMLSFTFMSDVQFLGWLMLAMLLYVRGIERRSDRSILLGSLAAACAIGTRQFGVCIIGGWLAALVVSAPERRPSLRQLALALAAPCALSLWQMLAAGSPNFTQAYRLAEQRVFFDHPPKMLVRELAWRLSIWAQYLSIFLLPVLPLAVGTALRAVRASRATGVRAAGLSLLVLALIAAGLMLSSELTVRPPPIGSQPWPALGIIWVLPNMMWRTPGLERFVDLLGLAALLPWLVLIFARPRLLPRLRAWSLPALLLAATAGVLIALQLIYVQFNDTYIIGLVPFALLALGSGSGRVPPARAWLVGGAVTSVAATLLMAGWMRADYDDQQTLWAAADRFAAQGLAYDRIAGPKHWAEYHGAFDDWIAADAPGLRPPPRKLRPGEDPFHDPFYAWLKQREHANAQAWYGR